MSTSNISRSNSRPRSRPIPTLKRHGSVGAIPFHPPPNISHLQHSSLRTTRQTSPQKQPTGQPTLSSSLHTTILPNTSPHKQQTGPLSASALSTTSASRGMTRASRDTMLEEFSTKFLKTKNDLHARNQQCELLASEIEKLQKELISCSELVEKLEFDEGEIKERYQEANTKYVQEADKHKALTHELTQLRKEKQERVKERAVLAQEHTSYQLACQQVYEESVKYEESAKNLSKKLQVVNKERLKYRQECVENQERINEYNTQMYKLQSELQEMRDVVFTSIGESMLHTSRQ